jgi:endoglucanase
MRKLLTAICTICILSTSFAQDLLRVNQLGYLPDDRKVAVFLSKSGKEISNFEVKEALSGKTKFAGKVSPGFANFKPFKTSYRLDFSLLKMSGAFYITAGDVQSTVFNISKTVYNETADFLLRYLRQQRCGFNPVLNDSCHVHDGYIIYGGDKDSSHIDAFGGWHDASDYLQYVTTTSNAVYHLLFAYQQNPKAFGDAFDARGLPGKNNIPDVLDEARWGLEWLARMNPDSGVMFNQLADDRDHKGFRLPNEDSTSYGKGLERPVYLCTGKPQGIFKHKNRATGIASTAGKYASSFALASQIFEKIDPAFAKKLNTKATQAYGYGKANPGVCQTAPCTAPYFYEEDNWTDDMELAAAQLFITNKNAKYLQDAIQYGKKEPVTPWMGADTARHYQWYPFWNPGHYLLAANKGNAEKALFIKNLENGIENVYQKGKSSPFFNGIPFIWCSNNLVAAMITQCRLYTQLTGNTKYAEMEAALRDWLLGCNPWGTSMIVGLPSYGDYPQDIHSALSHHKNYRVDGGLVDGPVYASIFKNLKGIYMAKGDEYTDVQPERMVYHDDFADYSTNEPTMDGTASLVPYFAMISHQTSPKQNIELLKGAIIRGNKAKKEIALVFTGHEFADGSEIIIKTLDKHKIKASFFFTGDFYRNPAFAPVIKSLINKGNYLGAHSDKHLLYCDWKKRDSTLIDKNTFLADLKNNYAEMQKFGIEPAQASYYLPPYEWYNDTIAAWGKQTGIKLVNLTPGTSLNQDWTYPALGKQYASSDSLYTKVLTFEATKPDGLNGFILLSHFGTDPRRTDKFYVKLDNLITELKKRGYTFKKIDEIVGEN